MIALTIKFEDWQGKFYEQDDYFIGAFYSYGLFR